ncbi:TPA: hypothetical protein HA372_02440 [Candidatus Woesearchaeota archaeon]|nr:hypothetical protein [Candidatus Woesearchaeota archaeon]HII64926.1 hypothetical protein [Candidatus Woesearchaeota archaeon]HIJ18525.1 hypothetical protein [Candidatus Woesearchaeota archaeon]
MAELVSLKEFTTQEKIGLLKELGYNSDGNFVTDKGGNVVLDRYIQQPIRLDNFLILPGSAIILDDNPVSLFSYLEEFPDVIW